jgi:hypothetical protein
MNFQIAFPTLEPPLTRELSENEKENTTIIDFWKKKIYIYCEKTRENNFQHTAGH